MKNNLKYLAAVFVCVMAVSIFALKRDIFSHQSVVAKKKVDQIEKRSDLIPQSVFDYFELLNEFKSGKKTSLEKVYQAGRSAMWDLGEVINDLSDEELTLAKSKMLGFELNPNNETITIHPVTDFFLNLAKSSGSSIDNDFFQLLSKTSSSGLWPNYFVQLTDLTGCTIYDGTLTNLYVGWTDFQKKYPTAYLENVKAELRDLLEEFTSNDCACDSKEKVVSEFQDFLKRPESSSLQSELIKRLEGIQNNTIKMTFNCGKN